MRDRFNKVINLLKGSMGNKKIRNFTIVISVLVLSCVIGGLIAKATEEEGEYEAALEGLLTDRYYVVDTLTMPHNQKLSINDNSIAVISSVEGNSNGEQDQTQNSESIILQKQIQNSVQNIAQDQSSIVVSDATNNDSMDGMADEKQIEVVGGQIENNDRNAQNGVRDYKNEIPCSTYHWLNAKGWADKQVGASIDWDHSEGAQCVDFSSAYSEYLIGLDETYKWIGGGASTYRQAYRTTPLPEGWIYVTSDYRPGDIFVTKVPFDGIYNAGTKKWDWKAPADGHIGLITAVLGNGKFEIVHQTSEYGIRAVRKASTYPLEAIDCAIRPNYCRPVINSVEIKDINPSTGTYTVQANITSEHGISKVLFPTWTEAGDKNGQDDLQWHEGELKKENGNNYIYEFTLKISDHNNERGKYITHVYAYDFFYSDDTRADVKGVELIMVEPDEYAVIEEGFTGAYGGIGVGMGLIATKDTADGETETINYATSNIKVDGGFLNIIRGFLNNQLKKLYVAAGIANIGIDSSSADSSGGGHSGGGGHDNNTSAPLLGSASDADVFTYDELSCGGEGTVNIYEDITVNSDIVKCSGTINVKENGVVNIDTLNMYGGGTINLDKNVVLNVKNLNMSGGAINLLSDSSKIIVGGSINQSGGTITVNKGSVAVKGNYTCYEGILDMSDAQGLVQVFGDFDWTGITYKHRMDQALDTRFEKSYWNAGTIELYGDIKVGYIYNPSYLTTLKFFDVGPEMKFILNGSQRQNLSTESDSLSFEYLEINCPEIGIDESLTATTLVSHNNIDVYYSDEYNSSINTPLFVDNWEFDRICLKGIENDNVYVNPGYGMNITRNSADADKYDITYQKYDGETYSISYVVDDSHVNQTLSKTYNGFMNGSLVIPYENLYDGHGIEIIGWYSDRTETGDSSQYSYSGDFDDKEYIVNGNKSVYGYAIQHCTGIYSLLESITLGDGRRFAKLTAKPIPSYYNRYGPTTWTSSDESVAIVDKDGNVTAVGVGEADITATIDNYSQSCHVYVTNCSIKECNFTINDNGCMFRQQPALQVCVESNNKDYILKEGTDYTIKWPENIPDYATEAKVLFEGIGNYYDSYVYTVKLNEHLMVDDCYVSDGNGTHYKECSRCKKRFDETKCAGSAATCMKKSVCRTCGHEFGELDSENHLWGNTTVIEDSTCSSLGKSQSECMYGCGAVKEFEIPMRNHVFNNGACINCGEPWQGTKDGVFYRTRSVNVDGENKLVIDNENQIIESIVTGRISTLDNVEIKDEFRDSSMYKFVVTEIAADAFNEGRDAERILIPQTVVTLGERSLYDAKVVEFVGNNVPEGIQNAIKPGTEVHVSEEAVEAFEEALNGIEDVTVTAVHIHELSGWKYDEYQHWKEYTCCDISEKKYMDNHSFTIMDTSNPEAIQSVDCETGYTVYYKTCECGAIDKSGFSGTFAVTNTEETGHKYSELSNCGSYHARKCIICGAIDESSKERHTIVNWNSETSTGRCEVCGEDITDSETPECSFELYAITDSDVYLNVGIQDDTGIARFVVSANGQNYSNEIVEDNADKVILRISGLSPLTEYNFNVEYFDYGGNSDSCDIQYATYGSDESPWIKDTGIYGFEVAWNAQLIENIKEKYELYIDGELYETNDSGEFTVTDKKGGRAYECSIVAYLTNGATMTESSNVLTRSTEGPFSYIIDENDDAIIAGYYGDAVKDLAIPTSIDGNEIKGVGEFCFYNSSLISGSIVIPSSVVSIGEFAFYNCQNLTEVVIENGVESIGSYAFGECCGLKKVTLPGSISDIGENAFHTLNTSRYRLINSEYIYPAGSYAARWFNGNNRANSYAVSYVNMDLTGRIGVNMYIDVTDIEPNILNSGTLHLEFDGKETIYNLRDLENAGISGGDYRIVRCVFAPKKISEKIRITIYDSDKNIIKIQDSDYSVNNNAFVGSLDDIIMNTLDSQVYSDDFADLFRCMSAYGNYARVYFGLLNEDMYDSKMISVIGESSLSNLNVLRTSITADDLAPYASKKSGSVDGLEYFGSTLVLESGTSIRHYFDVTGNHNISEYDFKINGTKVTPKERDGMYYIEIANIPSPQWNQMYNLSVGQFNLNYGVYSYIQKALSQRKNEKLCKLLEYMYLNGEAAVKCF